MRQDIPDEAIAIVGMAGRFPGAPDVVALWERTISRTECIASASLSQMISAGLPADVVLGGRYISAYGLLDSPELFDAALFRMTALEADALDPQARLFLTQAWLALHCLGEPQALTHNVGIYACSGYTDYWLRTHVVAPDFWRNVGKLQAAFSKDKDFVPNIASYRLNLHGPSVAIQAACASSMMAVTTACDGLRSRDCDIALAGGASVPYPSLTGYEYDPGGIVSPSGRCRPFDADADGTVPAQGVGVVVLKRLADAQRDGDDIVAVIRGYAVTNDGARKAGFAAPSVRGQIEAMQRALARSGVAPHSVRYIEAHGTGTAVGDPIEMRAIKAAYSEIASEEPLYIGSAKANFGHLDAAAGVTGLIKAALVLKCGVIPPLLNFERHSEHDRDDGRLAFPKEPIAWPGDPLLPRFAAVHSIGLGGHNAHVVLQSAGPALTSYDDRTRHAARNLRETRHWYGRESFDPASPFGSVAAPVATVERWGPQTARRSGRPSIPALCIVFSDTPSSSLAAEIAGFLPASSQVVTVQRGNALNMHDGSRITVDATDEGQIRCIFEALKDHLHDVVLVLYEWSINSARMDGEADAAARQRQLLLTVPAWIAKYLASSFSSRQRLSFVCLTSRLALVTAADEIDPLQSFILAPVRTIPREYPEVCTALLDVSADRSVDPAHYLDTAFLAPTGSVLAVRGGTIMASRLEQVEYRVTAGSELPITPGGTYLVTGGLGGIGLETAVYLAMFPRVRVVLLSRSAPRGSTASDPLSGIPRVHGMRKRGALEFVQADVTDPEQVAHAVETIVRRHGPISGIVHSAGVPGGALMHTRDPQTADLVLAPKVDGLLNLQRYVDFSSLDFIVLCSSLTTWSSHLGQYDYCAANAFLDAFAKQFERIRPGVVKSISWDVWREVGMATKSVVPDALMPQRIKSLNEGLSNLQGLLGLEYCLASLHPHIGISNGPVETRLAPSVTGGATNPPIVVTSPGGVRPAIIPDTRGPLSETEVARTISDIFCQHLGVTEVDRTVEFFDLGGDSLRVLAVADALSKAFACEFDATDLLFNASVESVAIKIVERRSTSPAGNDGTTFSTKEVLRRPVR